MQNVYIHLVFRGDADGFIFRAGFINTINIIKGFAMNNCQVYLGGGGCNKESFIKKVISKYNLGCYSNISFIRSNKNDVLYSNIKQKKINKVYSRDTNFIVYLARKKDYGGDIYYEEHQDNPPKKAIFYRNRVTHVTISDILKRRWGFKKSIVYPCSIDTDFFSTIPNNIVKYQFKFNIVYGGHVYPHKGIPILIDLGKCMKDVGIHIVGGKEVDIKQYKNLPNNVTFYGYKKQDELKEYLYGSDLLILPYTNKHYQSTTTSPIKLFEYMSTGKPILSSDIKGIKTWAKNKVYYYKADDLNDLIKNVQEIMEDKKQQIIGQREYAEKFSCKERCKLML